MSHSGQRRCSEAVFLYGSLDLLRVFIAPLTPSPPPPGDTSTHSSFVWPNRAVDRDVVHVFRLRGLESIPSPSLCAFSVLFFPPLVSESLNVILP